MHRNIKGTIVPLIAMMLASILGIGALVLDSSNAYLNNGRIKNALDLSVLAGVSQLINEQDVSTAKNTALNYLNLNLSMSINSFSNLTLGSENLSIQAGIYNFSNMTFTQDELNPAVNSLMISLAYDSPTLLTNVFMVSTVRISDSTIAVKRAAGQLGAGGGLPIFISSMALTDARLNNNMVNLTQREGEGENSYFTAFSDQNSNANDIRQILSYLEDPTTGTQPPRITVSDRYSIQVNNGQLGSVYMALDSAAFEGMTFVAPVGTLTGNNEGRIDGFVGVRIDDVYQSMGDWGISITIIPGYIDNSRGLAINSGPQNIDQNNQNLLATSFGLVQ